MLDANQARQSLTSDLEILEFEVNKLAVVFHETRFFEHPSNFPHAHYGYLMACMGKIDVWSTLWAGGQGKRHGTSPAGRGFERQTDKMLAFMAAYLGSDKEEEHRIAVQLFMHTIMHTGTLRYLYDKTRNIKYTWRVYFGDFDWYKVQAGHYTITDESDNYPGEVFTLSVSDGSTCSSVRAINVSIPRLVVDLKRALFKCLEELEISPDLQEKFLRASPFIKLQEFK